MPVHNMKYLRKKEITDSNGTVLNVAEICSATYALGPGQRFAIWLQGCCFRCQGCVSPDWIPLKVAHPVNTTVLADRIVSTPGVEGVTISGGEPMLQAKALLTLFKLLRQHQDISIMCFTGFTIESLRAQANPDIDEILNIIDVIIDGQYIEALNDNKGWRGSSNQVVHFLSERHLSDTHLFLERDRHVEIHLNENENMLVVGVPPKYGLSDNLRNLPSA